jgi:hypothetical protein
MRRLIPLIAAAATLAVPTTLGAQIQRPDSSYTYWQVVSASGTVTVKLDGVDPDTLQVEGSVTARWRTSRSVDRLTFPWPARPVAPLNDTETFTDLEKVKASIIGAAKGTTLGANPQSFSCNRNDVRAPDTFFNQPGEIPITGGALTSARLGIGIQHVNPYAVFEACTGPSDLPVSTILSGERIDWAKATFKPIPANSLRKGKPGQKLTLRVRETAPVDNASGTIGTAVSTATLTLRFVGAA